ncbi:MAG: hypothetical protein FD131_2103 [Rhodocyclaceae bacterium]|nr:MAG: hypothetical protein FD131_2103 [Rhodocyclaceae bacterium]
MEEFRRNQWLHCYGAGNIGNALLWIVQYFAQTEDSVEIGGENNFAGKLLGYVGEHLEALRLERIAFFVLIVF